ncbi:hypothetical protein VHEMI05869 [[Torrubiella] hemipterigena]|uniref:BHLH domain-containing protein n=1 Tax=[Torrubiella] hemipterigena TaxID=1531966 RepID=A0A0A1SZ14_9HYPO|nr:hypothetical protein VHEMI05869 [[Torrubiella] hemipterigena]
MELDSSCMNTSIKPTQRFDISDLIDPASGNATSFLYPDPMDQDMYLLTQLMDPGLLPVEPTVTDSDSSPRWDSRPLGNDDDPFRCLPSFGNNDELCYETSTNNLLWQQIPSLDNYQGRPLGMSLSTNSDLQQPPHTHAPAHKPTTWTKGRCDVSKKQKLERRAYKRQWTPQSPADSTDIDSPQEQSVKLTRNRHSDVEKNYRRRLNHKFNNLVAALNRAFDLCPPDYLAGPEIETAPKGQILDRATSQLLWLASESQRLNGEVGRLNELLNRIK